MLYGTLPGALTGQLSVPHPGGPSPTSRLSTAVTARPVPAVNAAETTPPLVNASAMQAARASHARFMMPPQARYVIAVTTRNRACGGVETPPASPRAPFRPPARRRRPGITASARQPRTLAAVPVVPLAGLGARSLPGVYAGAGHDDTGPFPARPLTVRIDATRTRKDEGCHRYGSPNNAGRRAQEGADRWARRSL